MLDEYKVRESDNPDRQPIDFSIDDGKDNVCWVWGATPQDVEWECDHPTVEFDDDETVGECVLCGATCDWHWNTYGDAGYTQKEQVPHEWHKPEKVGGLVKEYLKETYGE